MATASIDDYIPDLGGDELQNVQENTLPNNFQNYRQTSPPVNQGVIPSMLRMVGLDEQKLGMMALNMLVGESIQILLAFLNQDYFLTYNTRFILPNILRKISWAWNLNSKMKYLNTDP